MAESSAYFYREFSDYDEKAFRKNLNQDTLPVLQALRDGFRALGAWEKESLHQVVLRTAEVLDLKLGKVALPLRVALTGGTASPSIDETLALVGRDRTIARIERAQAKISADAA